MSTGTVTFVPQAHSTAAIRQQPTFLSLLRMEYAKLSKRLMTRVVFAFMAFTPILLIGLLGYLLTHVFGVGPDEPIEVFWLPATIGVSFEITSLLGAILIVVLAAGVAGSEYSWGTIRTLVGSGVDRGKLLAAKLVMVVGASFLFTLTGLAATALTSVVISLIEGHGLGLGWLTLSSFGDLLVMIARCSFVLAVFGILAFALTQVTRSVATGIAAGIGMFIISPILIALAGALGSTGDRIDDFILTLNSETLNEPNTFGELDTITGAPGLWQAAGMLTLYAVVAITVAVVVFRRRDIEVG